MAQFHTTLRSSGKGRGTGLDCGVIIEAIGDGTRRKPISWHIYANALLVVTQHAPMLECISGDRKQLHRATKVSSNGQ